MEVTGVAQVIALNETSQPNEKYSSCSGYEGQWPGSISCITHKHMLSCSLPHSCVGLPLQCRRASHLSLSLSDVWLRSALMAHVTNGSRQRVLTVGSVMDADGRIRWAFGNIVGREIIFELLGI